MPDLRRLFWNLALLSLTPNSNKYYSTTSWNGGVAPWWCVLRASEGGPFYSTNRSVPTIFKSGNSRHRHGVDKRIRSILPPKLSLNRLSGGSAGPWVRPNPFWGGLGPSLAGALLVGLLFRIHGARPWLVRLLCQMGLFWMYYAGSDVLCIFVVSSACFHVISDFVSLQSTIHQHSWNSLVITPTTTVDVHSSCLYAGVDCIYFGFNSRQ